MEDKNRKEFIRQVFNTVCEQYGTGSLRFFENAASHLPALLNLNGDENILDIATGTGLDEVNELADEEGIYFNVEVIHTIGEKA